jgi:hypothetical protein
MTDSTHKQAAALHTQAAQAHTAAADAHIKGDIHAAHNQTKKAHQCSSNACKHTEEIAMKTPEPAHV